MKTTLRIILSVAILSIGSAVVFADGGTTSGNTKKVMTLKPNYPIGYRPKAPSMQQVSCTYSDGNLYFEFVFPEGQCQLLLSDLVTGETVVAGFDSAASEPVYVGYHSTASLTVTTANGNTYSGIW